jgi:hypothetical protein
VRLVLYFANPCGDAVVAAMRAGLLGYIDTPAQGNKRPAGVLWCADNGAFSDRFDETRWWRFLQGSAGDAARCVFAVAPDVVADAAATLARSSPWLPRIRDLGYPVAFVAQDGIEELPVPWDDFDALFLGGTDGFKLGPVAREVAADAKARGKWVHMGRVNSEKRFRYARAVRCDSVDGTHITFRPRQYLGEVLAWTRGNDQLELF